MPHTAYIAIKPLEHKIQYHNPPLAGRPTIYPTILGADCSGTIVAIGDKVTTRKAEDRVMANACGLQSRRPEMSAFQRDRGTLLVWGGSSSVGCCAMQMASSAGYEVFATASKRNHGLCEALGAAQVFDHSNPRVEDEIVAALKGKTVVGVLDCISDDEKTLPACARILAKVEGKRKIAAVLTPAKTKYEGGVEVTRLSIPALRASETYNAVHEWMAKALANGILQPKPDPIIIGEGFESIQLEIDRVRKGVSAAKVVVRLS
ncbi:unnamed protein product [Zymoseptoria tritici ST99CH_1A5]|uniref:Enoyl reductase (ER) domain-containing protein n=2 Tax=Zymoseptoria tritici TaxID=1047171 RepID=F9XNZ3_ZYMTI|nr:uncharacterized protein MYCGRDRAFT_97124 [Zymoseptoria tritici IPO323]EGP83084.1 hypothetical protein MYCGRDRAFT_97124 [Zymoseptoria tritici IPO323]SMY29511.1 unnamed protein product [Zymoseptoria tritici ST99CH_1A5]